MIDTHTHLYVEQFDEDRAEMLKRANDQGIQKFFLPNIDRSSIDAMLALEAAYPEQCFAMMGLHPCSVKEDFEAELAVVEKWLGQRTFCAVGEIGIDLYWDKTFQAQQEIAFRRQINWAKDLDIPIVIHSRSSTAEVLEILKSEKDEKLRGIFHCFGGSETEARAIIELGFHLGIGGVLTFKKSGLDKTLASIPLDYMVLETDSPYLAPTPFRGKRNESAYLHQIAEKLAAIKERSIQEVAAITTRNAESIFETATRK
ncbi:MAG: TatD family hydrolase [Saprospiraceae bacterium]